MCTVSWWSRLLWQSYEYGHLLFGLNLPESFRRHLEHIRSVRKLHNLKSTIPTKLLLDFNLSKDILDFITLFLDNPSLCHASTTLFLFAFTFLLDLIIPLPVGPTSCIMGHTASSSSFRNQSALPILWLSWVLFWELLQFVCFWLSNANLDSVSPIAALCPIKFSLFTCLTNIN